MDEHIHKRLEINRKYICTVAKLPTKSRFKNINVVHPWTQTPQEKSVAQPGTLLLSTLSLVCEFDMKKVDGKLSNPLSKKNVHGPKHHREVKECKK